jgi:hypothetical protein
MFKNLMIDWCSIHWLVEKLVDIGIIHCFLISKLNLILGLRKWKDNSGIKTSHFFSPAYFQFGPGMLWKKAIT